VLFRVAEATLKDFLDRLAEALTAQVGSEDAIAGRGGTPIAVDPA
jgi:hypothetical protein